MGAQGTAGAKAGVCGSLAATRRQDFPGWVQWQGIGGLLHMWVLRSHLVIWPQKVLWSECGPQFPMLKLKLQRDGAEGGRWGRLDHEGAPHQWHYKWHVTQHSLLGPHPFRHVGTHIPFLQRTQHKAPSWKQRAVLSRH